MINMAEGKRQWLVPVLVISIGRVAWCPPEGTQSKQPHLTTVRNAPFGSLLAALAEQGSM